MSYNPYQYNNPDQYASTPTTPAYSTWDLEQDPGTSIQQEHPQPQVYIPTTTIHVPERVPSSSQGQFRLRDYVHQPAVHASEDPQQSGSHPPASHSSLPMRSASGREHARAAAHPYRRQPESQGSGSTMRTRRDVQMSETGSLRLAIPPIIGSSSVVMACPAQGHKASSGVPAVETTSPAMLQPPAAASSSSGPTKNFGIRADIHYDTSANLLKAMFELPGLKKADIKIMLSKCPYTRVKQITVSGRSISVFPDIGYTVRERKFGRFLRTLVVPPDTTADKVVAGMEDGVLTITVPGPNTPDALEEPANIGIP